MGEQLLNVGPSASVAVMCAATVAPLAAGDGQHAVHRVEQAPVVGLAGGEGLS